MRSRSIHQFQKPRIRPRLSPPQTFFMEVKNARGLRKNRCLQKEVETLQKELEMSSSSKCWAKVQKIPFVFTDPCLSLVNWSQITSSFLL